MHIAIISCTGIHGGVTARNPLERFMLNHEVARGIHFTDMMIVTPVR